MRRVVAPPPLAQQRRPGSGIAVTRRPRAETRQRPRWTTGALRSRQRAMTFARAYGSVQHVPKQVPGQAMDGWHVADKHTFWFN